jgi:hypothetical protein
MARIDLSAGSGGGSCAAETDQLQSLHQRLLRGDHEAREELAANLMLQLRQRLRAAFPSVDAALVHDAAVDAILVYLAHPERFDGTRGTALDQFAFVVSWRRLANSVRDLTVVHPVRCLSMVLPRRIGRGTTERRYGWPIRSHTSSRPMTLNAESCETVHWQSRQIIVSAWRSNCCSTERTTRSWQTPSSPRRRAPTIGNATASALEIGSANAGVRPVSVPGEAHRHVDETTSKKSNGSARHEPARREFISRDILTAAMFADSGSGAQRSQG